MDEVAYSDGRCAHVSANAEHKWCLKCDRTMDEVKNLAGETLMTICLKCGWHESEAPLYPVHGASDEGRTPTGR